MVVNNRKFVEIILLQTRRKYESYLYKNMVFKHHISYLCYLVKLKYIRDTKLMLKFFIANTIAYLLRDGTQESLGEM